MTDGLKDVHREAIIATIAANDRVERAVLFGSRATGTNTMSSDVDIALFGDRLTLTDLARLAAALEEIPMAQAVDLLLYNSIQDRTLREHIRCQGVEWHARPTRDEGYGTSSNPGCRSDWTLINLGRACTKIGSGATPRGGKDVYLPNGPYALIRSQNVLNDGFRHDGLAYIGERHACELAGVEVLDKDVLLNITGDSVARACQVDPHVLPARVNQHVAIIRPDPAKLDPGFIRYFLVCPETQAKLVSWAGSGGTRNALTKGMIDAFDVFAPENVPEQRAIAHILGTLDDKIELNQRMNATLEALARALFKSWFVDFDPVRAKMKGRDTGLPKEIADLFPDRLVDSELGKMPEGWRAGHVEDGFEIIMGQSPPGHTYNDTGDGLPFFQGRSDFGFRYPKNRKFCTAPNRTAQSWDTIVSVRAPVGDINMAREQCCIGRGVAALRYRSGGASFTYYTVQSLQIRLREYEHTGTVFGAINRKQLARLPLQQPAADVVRAFEHLVHPWDQTIRLRTAQSDILTALRDVLLPKLVSGELRVNRPEVGLGKAEQQISVGAADAGSRSQFSERRMGSEP